jgi:DNA-binding MarR family transcriptional regulator
MDRNGMSERDDEYVLDDQVGYLLRLANQRHLSIFNDLIIGGLTSVQFSTLFRLRHAKGPVSQNALGRFVGMDAATTKGVVTRLIARDLVQVERDPGDKRRYHLSTTPKGRTLIEEAMPQVRKISQLTLEPLSPDERTSFIALLKKLC